MVRTGFGQGCQLDGDMFDDVTEVSSFFESLHKTTTPSETALVII
jgi:hypothetical protein